VLEKNLAFHTSGHVLHSLFWQNLSPTGGDKPAGDLAAAIDRDFGSFDGLMNQLSQATNSVQGSGWGTLAFETASRKLVVQQIYDHQGNAAVGSTPLLVIDAWEHANHLQYENVRADFVNAIWNIINWQDVANRFAAIAKP
jgi:Fe-Mn family superoxide dismutase